MKHYEHFSIPTSVSHHYRWVVWICATVLLTFAFAFCGCVSRPALSDQTFAFSTPVSPPTSNVASGHVLEIRSLRIAPPFDGRSLIYRTGEFSYQRDPYAQFLGLPVEGLVGPIGEMLRHDGGFSAVVQPGSSIQPDTMVEITISQLYGDIRRRKDPCAVLAMHVTFMNATNGLPGRVILDRNYSRQTSISRTAPAALMEGWSRSLSGIITEVISDYRRQETGKQSQAVR
jgi:ABC-type uncharacterized transport system auxiliary subunit